MVFFFCSNLIRLFGGIADSRSRLFYLLPNLFTMFSPRSSSDTFVSSPGRSPTTLASPGLSPTLSSPASSPSLRHLRYKNRKSPMEMRERMRQSYKERISKNRHMLLNNLRSAHDEVALRNSVSLMLREMFESGYKPDDDDIETFEAIKEELVQAETNWLVEEYEKGNFETIDWSAMDSTEEVICPTCQKVNLVLTESNLTCLKCIWTITTDKSICEINSSLHNSVESHSQACNMVPQFTVICDAEVHLFLICGVCYDMRMIL